MKKFLAVFLLFSFAANAQQPDISRQQDRIIQQQQNELEKSKIKREQETIEKERQRRLQEKTEIEVPNYTYPKVEKCAKINQIKFGNQEILPANERNNLVKVFFKKCGDDKVLKELSSNIEAYFKKKGWMDVTVQASKPDLKGVVEIKISQGKVEDIILGDDSTGDKMQELTAFGTLNSEELDLDDINQGLYQINRLPSNHANLKITPGKNGKAKVYIVNDKKFPARAKISHDNYGTEFSGIRRTRFTSGFDNMLSLNDNLELSYLTNLNDSNDSRDLKTFTSMFSLPFGYYTFTYDFYHSEFRNSSFDGNSKGFSNRNQFTINRVLLNKLNLRISTFVSLTAKEASSYFNGAKVEGSRRNLTIANVGFTFSKHFNETDVLYLKPSFAKGLNALNSLKNNSDAALPQSEFELLKIYGSYIKKFATPIPFTYLLEGEGQYSKDSLYGSEQMLVGSYDTVRGFRENFIFGDSGYYLRNKLSFNLGTFYKPLNKFALEPFFDYGYVKNNYYAGGADGRLSGSGLKTTYIGKNFSAALTYSRSNNKSRLSDSLKKENEIILFEITAACCS